MLIKSGRKINERLWQRILYHQLKNMRKFYIIQKGQPLVDRLTWTNWTLLFPIKMTMKEIIT